MVIPDYSKSMSEVYFDVAKKIFDNTSSLSLLSSVQVDHTNGSMRYYYNSRGKAFDKELPSWVPQWQFLLTQTLNLAQPDPNFAACGGRKVERKNTSNQRSLVLRGLIVNKVERCSYGRFGTFWRGAARADMASGVGTGIDRPINTELPDLDDILSKAQKTRADLEELAITLTAGKNWYGLAVHDLSAHLADYARCLIKDGLLWSLLRTDPGNQSGDGIPARSKKTKETNDSSTCGFINKDELEVLSQGGNADRFLDAVATACERRARLVLDDGMIGIGPEAAKKDDLVCIIYGANIPFVIRQEKSGYRLIGECYLRHLMRGEAVSKLLDANSQLVESWIELD
jgi:hypothetical protein